MNHYIDKDALEAEIKRRIKEIEEIGTYLSPKGTLTNLLCFLNTFNVKEEDLDKEIDRYFNTEEIPVTKDALRNTARYFAEWQKKQLMKDVIIGIARPADSELWCNLDSFNLKDGNKVKVIVIKED